MARSKDPDDQLPLTPSVFHILVALSDGERHGYGIMRQVAEDTAGSLQLGPGTLYGCLQRMLSAGLVEESDWRPDPQLDDERRPPLAEQVDGGLELRAHPRGVGALAHGQSIAARILGRTKASVAM